MKRLIFILPILISVYCDAQTIRANDVVADRNLYPPVFDTIVAPGRVGDLRVRVQDTSIYMAISITAAKKWTKIAKVTDFVATDISGKLNISDTAAMLSPYIHNHLYGLGKTGQRLYLDSATVFPHIRATIPPMVYPGAGIPNSTGSAWGTSYTTTGSGTVVALQTNPTFLGTVTSHKYIATDTGTSTSPGGTFLIYRNGYVRNDNGHGFVDRTWYQPTTDGLAYAAFDAAVETQLNRQHDHLIGFQSRVGFASIGHLNDLYGGATLNYVSNGTVSRSYGWDVFDPVVTAGGVIDTSFGFRVQQLSAGTKNYAFAAEGTTPSFMMGKLGIGKKDPTYPLHVYSSTLASTAEDNIFYTEGDGGRGSFAVTNWGTVYISQSDGSGGTLGNIYLAEPNSKIGMSFAPTGATRFDFYADNVGTHAFLIGKRVSGSTTNYIRVYNDDNLAFGADAASLTTPIAGVHFSKPGAVSFPAILMNGTWYNGGSGTTTKPFQLIEPIGTTSTGWSTAGTGLGVNAATGFAGNLADFQVAGASKLKITAAGGITIGGSGAAIILPSNGSFYWAGRTAFYSPSDGVLELTNNAYTGFTRLTLGPATSSFPAIARNGTDILIKDASNGTASGLGVGVSSVSASAVVEVASTTKGFLPPRMTATQASAISSPAEGLLVYVTDTNGTFASKGWWGWSGAAWEKLNN